MQRFENNYLPPIATMKNSLPFLIVQQPLHVLLQNPWRTLTSTFRVRQMKHLAF